MFYALILKNNNKTLVEDIIMSTNSTLVWKEVNKRHWDKDSITYGIFKAEDEKNIAKNMLKRIFAVIGQYSVQTKEQAKMLLQKGVWDEETYEEFIDVISEGA